MHTARKCEIYGGKEVQIFGTESEKVRFSLCLTKYRTMKKYPVLN